MYTYSFLLCCLLEDMLFHDNGIFLISFEADWVDLSFRLLNVQSYGHGYGI